MEKDGPLAYAKEKINVLYIGCHQRQMGSDIYMEFGVLCCLTTPGLKKDIRRKHHTWMDG